MIWFLPEAGASRLALPQHPCRGLNDKHVTLQALEAVASTFLFFTSFHVPGTIYRFDLEQSEPEVWARIEIPVDTAELEVEQVFYPSKDGTRIPMYVLHRRDMQRDGSNLRKNADALLNRP